MHIFIDESGTFQLDNRKKATPSAVGAVVIPTPQMRNFEKLIGRLRLRLPTKERGEVKGRLLSESQVSDVVDVMKRVGALFEICVIDPAMHTEKEIYLHREQQANKITNLLTSNHHSTLVAEVWDLRRQLEKISVQLYLQSVALNELVYNVLNHADSYFAFRFPKELGVYHWVLDAKDRDRIPLGKSGGQIYS